MSDKDKKFTFSKEIDDKISGIAVGFAFLTIGLFLLIYPDYFGHKLATSVIRWIFITIGTLGLLVEFNKRKSSIKGVGNFFLGALLGGIWIILSIYTDSLWINVLSFFLLLMALYGLYRGLIEIIYSSFQTVKKDENNKKVLITDIILLLTKILSLILILLQIIKVLETY